MSSLSILNKVTFGRDDAESDATLDFFEQVFLKTSFYNRILTEQKILVTEHINIDTPVKTNICNKNIFAPLRNSAN
jgi:hypothetical protein